MRTKVYFVRLIEVNEFLSKEDARLLSLKGMEDANYVTRYLMDKKIQAIYSSPYKRAYDTLRKFSQIMELPIITVDAFRGHSPGKEVGNVMEFMRKQWADFDYKTPDGESLREIQQRSMEALRLVLEDCMGKDIVIGTHGTPLSTIINYYHPNFGYEDYVRFMEKMPFIASAKFSEFKCESIDTVDLIV